MQEKHNTLKLSWYSYQEIGNLQSSVYVLDQEKVAKIARNIYQRFSQKLAVFGNTPSDKPHKLNQSKEQVP